MNEKEIRFIDSHYNELFKIPDGGQIAIKYPDGHSENRVCKYIDEYHTAINGVCFHICEWAEYMELNKRQYLPANLFEKLNNIKYTEQNADILNRDVFYKTDYGVEEVYYNSDSEAGGQFVVNKITNELIKEALKYNRDDSDGFFEFIAGCCEQYLIDIDTPDFNVRLDSFIKRQPDFEGESDITMKGLLKHAGVKEKSHKDIDMER